MDKIPDVAPLRATGISMLKGKTAYAVVCDSDISINYSPLLGNLMGSNLGTFAFEVLDVRERKEGSTSSLPIVTIKIHDAKEVSSYSLKLFTDAPVPQSSSEPFDITP